MIQLDTLDKVVHVVQDCRVGTHEDCKCRSLYLADPERVGYPPYHDGCRCFVIHKVDKEPVRKCPK
jgi:hypothetical protein